ncbi:Protein argonaute 7 [Carex littledalei]|uniref:Protein argonaute 7 n=1 Tax=Carex littledalei TaxID=544730 RepID=A0A833QPF1_9POAL|nr:Protein argonaute 7 [Carex littledalei]
MEKAKKGRNRDTKRHNPLPFGAHQNAMPLMEIPPIIQNGYPYQYRYHQSCPALLPLPLSLPLPPPFLLYVPPAAPLYYEHNSHKWRTNGQNGLRKQRPVQNQVLGPTEAHFDPIPLRREVELPQNLTNFQNKISHIDLTEVAVVRRPDSGGTEGPVIPLLVNHFLVQFDPTQRIFHYDVNISPRPSLKRNRKNDKTKIGRREYRPLVRLYAGF